MYLAKQRANLSLPMRSPCCVCVGVGGLSFKFFNHWTNFYEICVNAMPLEDIATVIFNFLHSVITTWWMHELLM